MNQNKMLIVDLLATMLVVLLIVGSCGGPVFMYYQSPWWVLDEVDPYEKSTFRIAYMLEDSNGVQQLQITSLEYLEEHGYCENCQYFMPEERMDIRFGNGSGNARIYVKNEEQGSQLIQVSLNSDTGAFALSEYRVADNKIEPLRYGFSQSYLLLLGIIFPILAIMNAKRINRGIKRIMGGES